MRRRQPVLSFLFAVAFMLGAGSASAQAPQDRFADVGGMRLHYLDWGGAGKQPMTSEEFLRGMQIKPGTRVN